MLDLLNMSHRERHLQVYFSKPLYPQDYFHVCFLYIYLSVCLSVYPSREGWAESRLLKQESSVVPFV